MSQIETVYSNLAAKTVAFTGANAVAYSLTAKNLSALPNSLASGDVPARLLLPYASGTEDREGSFVTFDAIGRVEWYVSELFVRERVGLGNLADIAPDILSFRAAYYEMLRSFKDCGITGGNSDVELIGWRAVPGIYDYPIGSNTWWHGVLVVLRVLEVMAG